MKNTASPLRLLALAFVGLISMGLTGCFDKTTNTLPPPGPLDNATEQKLAYGISMKIPQGWRVVASSQENTPPTAELKKSIAKNKSVEMLRIVRTEPNGQICAEAALVLAHVEQAILPPDLAHKATEQHLAEFNKMWMEEDKKEAAKQKRQSDLLDLATTKSTINGNMVILQSALGKRPDGGTMRVLQYDMYLPEATSLLIYLKGQSEIPGLEEQMKAMAESVTVAKQ